MTAPTDQQEASHGAYEAVHGHGVEGGVALDEELERQPTAAARAERRLEDPCNAIDLIGTHGEQQRGEHRYLCE